MNKKNLVLVLIVFLSVVAGLVLGNLLAERSELRAKATNMAGILNGGGSKIDELLALIDNQYVDSVDVNKLTEEVMVDLITKLDPHSVYIPASDLEDVNSELEGSFSGIGVQFNIQNDTVMIVSIISGGPSEKVGLLAGDRIIQVDDSLFVGKKMTNERVIKTLRGPMDTEVELGVKRNGTKEMLTYTVTRGKIPLNSMDVAYMVEPEIGFIKLSKFSATSYDEFMNAIADLRNKGAKKYIIDLRENSGGFMDQAINMVNEFLPADQMIVYSEGRSYPRSEARSDGSGSCIGSPVVVLMDEFSASASEIFAGAMQDNDRGLIVGRRSFGKGLVQQQKDLSDGSAIRLTVARYYTPSGRSIQKPYVKGNAEDYEKDILNRFLHGEFDSQDSIEVADSLKYKTLKGRTVYGGGGIMPDVFVPRDTSEYTPYLNKIINQGYIYQFAFRYTDNNRKKLNTFRDWKSMGKYLESQDILNDFVAFVAEKGIAPNKKDIAVSGNLMLTQLKAYIIRNTVGDDGFYQLLYQKDKTVKKAIETIKKVK